MLYNGIMKISLPGRTGWFLAGMIAAVAVILMLSASANESAIVDELAHIPAGYGYVRYLDFRLNPEHPPLLKALAGIPLLFLDVNFPDKNASWTSEINSQWATGGAFLYGAGNDADRIVQASRLGAILLTVLTVLFLYFWSSRLLGKLWGLVPVLLFGLSPSVLAHGHFVTTDAAAVFGILVATYFFLRSLGEPSRWNILWAGLTFGLAALTKFSTVLLVPFFLFLILVFYLAEIGQAFHRVSRGARLRHFSLLALRHIRNAAVIMLIGYVLVVYPVYLLFTWNYPVEKQVSDTEFILTSFAGGPPAPGETCKPVRCLADLNIRLAESPVLRPFGEYMLGVLMVMQRSAGGNTAYFLGQVSAAGSPWYFPVVYLLKEPLPVIILFFAALLLGLRAVWRKIRERGLRVRYDFLDYLSLNFTEFAMLVFVLLYWAWSIQSPLNIGFRHLFPVLPFTYILAASAWKKWVWDLGPEMFRDPLAGMRKLAEVPIKYVFLVVLLFWFLVESLAAAPYFLSYFNQVGGGGSQGYRYVTDSNYDWGQDLKRLKDLVRENPEIDRIAVDYFGGGSAEYYLPGQSIPWWSSKGDPRDQGIYWLAISVNTLQGAIQPAAPGFDRKPEDEYRWLTELRPRAEGMGGIPEPDFRAGTSIFVYELR